MKTKIKLIITGTSLFVAIQSQGQWLINSTNTHYNPLSYNVGIGTKTPLGKLEIQSGTVNNTPDNITALMITKQTGAANPRRMFVIPHLSGWSMNKLSRDGDMGIFWTDGANGGGQNKLASLVIAPWSGSNNGIRITPEGNVGIGRPLDGNLNNPNNYKLAVNGTIGAKAVKIEVTSGWPDYVFNEKYTLKSINELEAFINKNKHLPNVPSADEVGKNGIDLGNMDAALLEKIEELSLYIIQQNKRIEELEEKMSKK